MEFCMYRWGFSLGTKHWRNAISWRRGGPQFHIGHLQLVTLWYWKPRWPQILDRDRFVQRVLGPANKRWTALNIGLSAWPVIVGLHWHATCHGCVGAYARDFEEYNRLQAKDHRREYGAPA